MILETDSLLYQCFKARYFPQSTFLDAVESPNSSFVWRSIMAALPILKSGYCWRVGNGSSIRVLGDKWIPNQPTNKIIHPANGDINDWLVSDQIDHDLHSWQTDVAMTMFHREDAEALCKISLSWRYVCLTPSSGFTIKMGCSLSNQLIR